jgi:class 3 adenylate cyclase
VRAAALLLLVLARVHAAQVEAPRDAPFQLELPLAAPALPAAGPALIGGAAALPGAVPQPGASPQAVAAPSAASPAPAQAPPSAPLGGPGVYERRSVGLLALDFKDSTALHLAEGNRKARALIGASLDFAAHAAARFDGSVVRRLGDGLVIAFPDRARAMAAAERIQLGMEGLRRGLSEPRLELRAGVHAGRVLVDATGARPEVYGQPVEEAVALAARGEGGELVTAEGARRPRPAGPARAPGFQPPLSRSGFTRAATLFASLEDGASAYERLGRRAAYAQVKAFHSLAAEVVAARGGFVVKSEGETVMASFASARDAVEAGLELQRRLKDGRARVGVSYGRVLREDRLEGPDFFGNTVNAAARFMRLARPGEVVAGESVLQDERAREAWETAPREQALLKGFAQPVGALRLSP